jgi:small subunit ribosomal protein S20
MPHSKQAKKRLRQSEKSRVHNQSQKSSMKTHIKKVVQAINEGDAEAAKKEMPTAMKKIDKAVKRNLIHKNEGSRRISRLSKKIDQLGKKGTDN